MVISNFIYLTYCICYIIDEKTPCHSQLPPGEHDTIGMISLDPNGDMAAGTSTNGLQFKIPGRVSDSALVGSGAYVDNEVGGACATGDGDVMQRFVPSYHAVQLMRQGSSPDEACLDAIKRIAKFYPTFTGAVLALDKDGRHGAACHGIETFPYSVMQQGWKDPQIIQIPCLKS
jgi:N4-(beta-N-acetylglucosaminyl)-L-asparaginase